MKQTIRLLLLCWLSFVAVYASAQASSADDRGVNATALLEMTTSMAVLDASSLVQAGLQEKGFRIRFIQPVEKGLKKYQENPGYLRVIVFDPPASDVPAGSAGDELHVFIPLRVAVIEMPGEGSKVSSMPYSAVANTLSEEAKRVMSRWGADIAEVIEGLPR